VKERFAARGGSTFITKNAVVYIELTLSFTKKQ